MKIQRGAVQRGFTLIELMIVVAIIAILAAIAISQYQDYVIRSQVAEAATLADGAKSAVGEFLTTGGHFGAKNESIGLPAKASIEGHYVSELDASNGIIKVTFNSTTAAGAIQGKSISFSPITHAGSIEWRCNPGASLDKKYVPTVCRD